MLVLLSACVWRSGVNRKKHDGGIAQLGERLHGMQEVIGSIPFTSTMNAWMFTGSVHAGQGGVGTVRGKQASAKMS